MVVPAGVERYLVGPNPANPAREQISPAKTRVDLGGRGERLPRSSAEIEDHDVAENESTGQTQARAADVRLVIG